MNIDQRSLAYIEKVISTASLLGIENIIIEPGRVRAVDEDSTAILLQQANVPPMPFGSIGINRINIFNARYNVVREAAKFELTANVEGPEGATYARSLLMKARGVKIDYRCANPATIRAPKGFNDVVKYRAQMHPDAVAHLQKAATAMESDELLLVGNDTSVSFEVADVNGDKMTLVFGDTVDNMVSDDESPVYFAHKYPIKTLQRLFKHNPDGYFYVTSRGMLKIIVNELDVYILPRT